MLGYRDEMYGDRAARLYDEMYADFTPPAEMIAMLKTLCETGDAVEVGVGTGRVAIPLAQSGVHVSASTYPAKWSSNSPKTRAPPSMSTGWWPTRHRSSSNDRQP